MCSQSKLCSVIIKLLQGNKFNWLVKASLLDSVNHCLGLDTIKGKWLNVYFVYYEVWVFFEVLSRGSNRLSSAYLSFWLLLMTCWWQVTVIDKYQEPRLLSTCIVERISFLYIFFNFPSSSNIQLSVPTSIFPNLASHWLHPTKTFTQSINDLHWLSI